MSERNGDPSPDRAPPPPRAVVIVAVPGDDPGPCARLLSALSPGSRMAFVVVLDARGGAGGPGAARALADGASLPVAMVNGDDVPLRAGRVHVLPPEGAYEIHAGRLLPAKVHREPASNVDRLVSSLAADQRERAICVLLSDDAAGALQGLREVQAQGGIVVASQRASRVPDDFIDLHVPTDTLPAALARCGGHMRLPSMASDDPADDDRLRRMLVDLLRQGTGMDFGSYRRDVLARSVRRRIVLTDTAGLDGYLERLRVDAREAPALSRDLLLRPAGFFRDPEAWRALEQQVLAPMLTERDSRGEWRVWVPACATGEEAYSVAIAMIEQMEAAGRGGRLMVFATDADRRAVDVARAGRYARHIERAMSRQRLERFFVSDGDGYAVRRELRQTLLFAPHDVTAAPAFWQLDLVVCRDFLPLLETACRARIISRWHQGLEANRALMVGKREAADVPEGDFEPLARAFGLYRRAGSPPHGKRADALGRVDGDPRRRADVSAAPQAQGLLERELQRMHRELRQAMEAVESTNEELTTVNTMLAEKIVDVEKANDDLTNLLASTLTPTLFLDRGLRLRQFTPASTALFPLRPGDVGRPIADVVGRAPVDVLLADAQQVLERLVPVERELALGDDRYLQRVLPYRDRDGRVEGVVAAYVDITETTRAQERLEAVQGLTARIEQAREEERARIAREIHDELGATLTGIQMHLRAAFADASARQIELPGPLADVPGLVDSARHAVNRIIGDLRPSVLDHLGVWAAITWYAERVLEPAGIAWQTDIPRALEAIELAPDRATAIFRIAQEALTNVVRHAGAATVEIRARAEGDALVMEVRDDGRGIAASAAAHARHGVLGMHERARYFGGHLDIAADDAGGTAVMLRMPMRGAPGATR